MNQNLPIVLTTMDYAVLESLIERGADAPHVGPLRRKLASAIVVVPAEIGPDVVTLNSRVRYRLDNGAVEERVLVANAREHNTTLMLPVTSPRGLALLGRTEGQRVVVRAFDGTPEALTVEQIQYQPEAHLRVRGGDRAHTSASLPPNGSVNVVRLTRRARSIRVPTFGDDDPGPSAA